MKFWLGQHWGSASFVLYCVLAIIGGQYIHNRESTQPTNSKGDAMDWAEVKSDISIEARMDGAWTVAWSYVKGPALMQIEASDETWEYAPGKKCSANGDLISMLSAQDTVLPAAPVGSMIGKIGGSTVGFKDGRLFVCGKLCMIEIDQSTSGPVFLNINDELTGMQNNKGTIKVKMSIKPTLPPPAPVVPSVGVAPALSNPSMQLPPKN
jgi:hypothetical protein